MFEKYSIESHPLTAPKIFDRWDKLAHSLNEAKFGLVEEKGLQVNAQNKEAKDLHIRY